MIRGHGLGLRLRIFSGRDADASMTGKGIEAWGEREMQACVPA